MDKGSDQFVPEAQREIALEELEHHRHVIECLPGGVIRIASDGAFLSANREALKFLGLSIDALTQRIIPDYAGETIHEDGTPCPVGEYPATRCLAGGLPQPPVTIGVRRPDGETVWAVFTAVPMQCPIHPGRLGTIVAFLDITQRKRVEDALRRSEDALRQAHEQLEQRVIERTGELARINQMLREQITERRRLEEEVLQISERERHRIGQDLHDGLGQHLTGIAFLSKSLQQRLATKAGLGAPATAEEAAEAGRIVELVQQAVTQTRNLARGLHPVEATPDGLTAALREFAARIEAFFRLKCGFVCDRAVSVPDNAIATHLYRIAQEAVNNAIKHAKTKRITIGLEADGDAAIHLVVEDDGIGIGESACRNGLGLRIMRYRANIIGGAFEVERRPAGGTRVACSVPMAQSHARPVIEEDLS